MMQMSKATLIVIFCAGFISACGKKGLPGQDKESLTGPIGAKAEQKDQAPAPSNEKGFVLDPLIK